MKYNQIVNTNALKQQATVCQRKSERVTTQMT